MNGRKRSTLVKELLSLVGHRVAIVFDRKQLITSSGERREIPCFKWWISKLSDSSFDSTYLLVYLCNRPGFVIEEI